MTKPLWQFKLGVRKRPPRLDGVLNHDMAISDTPDRTYVLERGCGVCVAEPRYDERAVAGEFSESLQISRYTAAAEIDYHVEPRFFDECPKMTDWEMVVSQNVGVVWRTADRLVGNHADAWDCVQETFLEAVKIDRRELVRDWSGLLRHLATVRALDLLRVRYRQRQRCDPEVDTSLAIGREPDPPCQAQANELADRLRASVSQLPRRQAQVFCLSCFEKMTSEQVGERLGISATAARMLLSRARQRLRRILVSDGAHGEDD